MPGKPLGKMEDGRNCFIEHNEGIKGIFWPSTSPKRRHKCCRWTSWCPSSATWAGERQLLLALIDLIKIINEAYSWVSVGRITAFGMFGDYIKKTDQQLLGRIKWVLYFKSFLTYTYCKFVV